MTSEINRNLREIQRTINRLEKEAGLINAIRNISKKAGGHFTERGLELLDILYHAGLRQVDIARIFDVAPSTIAQRLNKKGT